MVALEDADRGLREVGEMVEVLVDFFFGSCVRANGVLALLNTLRDVEDEGEIALVGDGGEVEEDVAGKIDEVGGGVVGVVGVVG